MIDRSNLERMLLVLGMLGIFMVPDLIALLVVLM